MALRHPIPILIFLTLFLAVSCKKDTTDYSHRTSFYKNIHRPITPWDSTLTVITYNVQLGFPASLDPWDPSHLGCTPEQLDTLLAVMRSVDPDIILLQEVPYKRPNTIIREFTEKMAEKLQMNYAFGSHGYNEAYTGRIITGEWGNAIFSRFPVREIENRETYYQDKWVRRSTLKAVLQVDNNLRIDAYSLHHLPSSDGEMNRTVDFINESLNEVIVGGDFNRGYGHPEMDQLQLQNTFADSIPYIDRIYTSDVFDVSKVSVIEMSKGVSDHWAFYAGLKLK